MSWRATSTAVCGVCGIALDHAHGRAHLAAIRVSDDRQLRDGEIKAADVASGSIASV